MKVTTFELNDEGKLEAVQEYPVVLNQIAYFHGYGHDRERLAVIKIEKDERFGNTYYHLLNLDKPSLSKHEYLRPIETRKGSPIGIYFKQGELATQEEIDEVMPMAEAAEQMKHEKQNAINKANEERREKAAIWWKENTPSWAKAYIVAELKEDKSDSQSDYFHASTSKTLLLAWSTTDRLNFAEMRKAALNAPETKELIEELKEDRYHRILGNYYHGWAIKKYKLGNGKSWTEEFVGDNDILRLPKETPKETPQEAQPTGDKIAVCKLNTEKGGIEIYFNSKPAQSILDDLKANGFRWSKFNKCWYKIDTLSARMVASKYATVRGEENHDGGMVQANEEAGADNWAQANL